MSLGNWSRITLKCQLILWKITCRSDVWHIYHPSWAITRLVSVSKRQTNCLRVRSHPPTPRSLSKRIYGNKSPLYNLSCKTHNEGPAANFETETPFPKWMQHLTVVTSVFRSTSWIIGSRRERHGNVWGSSLARRAPRVIVEFLSSSCYVRAKVKQRNKWAVELGLFNVLKSTVSLWTQESTSTHLSTCSFGSFSYHTIARFSEEQNCIS